MHKSLLAGVALFSFAGIASAADTGTTPDGGPPAGRPMMNVEDHFKAADTNHDGKLSPEEFAADMDKMREMRQGMGPGRMDHQGPPPPAGATGEHHQPDPARMQQMRDERLKAADTNHDGFLSLDEMKAAHEKMMQMRRNWREHGPGGKPHDDAGAHSGT